MKPYQQIPIEDCGELLVGIPLEIFALESPHPYEKLGAIYQSKSPYFLRESVLNALIEAQSYLQRYYPGWRIKIFDAYRPIEVQQFMVNYTFNSVLQERGLDINIMSPNEQQKIWEEVYQIWAIPNYDPSTPPPHSTGAAVDITLVDATGNTLDLGGEIDEMSERSQPNYYANSKKKQEQIYHERRQLLNNIMIEAGFCRHQGEWWHFSLGDQMWAWQYNQAHPDNFKMARYGRIYTQSDQLSGN